MQLTVLTYNILNGGHGREAVIRAIIESLQPDIVLLQELLDADLLVSCGKLLNAYTFLTTSNSRFRLGLISRYPIIKAQSYHPFPICRALLEATIALPFGQTLQLWGVHLMPQLAFPFELWRAWEIHVILRRTRQQHQQLCLIAGDFNAIAPGERVLVHLLPPLLKSTVLAQGGRVYHHAIAAMLRAGWTDCYRTLHPHSDGWTLPSSRPNARLDYIFVSAQLTSSLRECAVVTDPPLVRSASDHLPLKASFTIDEIPPVAYTLDR